MKVPQLSEIIPLRRMEPPVPTTATAIDGDGEWELCNDDGFVYKRRKRDDISDAGETWKPPDPELDPVVEERNRRIKKKRIMLKLKRKYQREIDQWEILSNSLNAMQERADRFQTPQREERRIADETTSFPESCSGEHAGEDASALPPSLLDQLLFMVIRVEKNVWNWWLRFEFDEEMIEICR